LNSQEFCFNVFTKFPDFFNISKLYPNFLCQFSPQSFNVLLNYSRDISSTPENFQQHPKSYTINQTESF
jgi:hypothetical protein